ncbi:MAG: family 4 glycosyl hydrolase [Planctomycetota bacterium]|jgi:alpha-galactosidase
MQHPKVVILGAGSLFFGRQAIWQMVHSEHLRQGTLCLVDTDEQRLEKMAKLAEMVIEHTGVGLELEASTERKDVLKDADFVVLSFARDTVKYRGLDCDISVKYGIRMCSGDTTGPGGIFRTMREFPVILEVCKDVESLCPDAWVINYVNPTAVHGIGLRRFAPNIKSFALCDSLHMPHVKRNYAKRAGIIKSDEDYTPDIAGRFKFRVAGPNHFTWLLKAEFDGRDVTGKIAESLRKAAASETAGERAGSKAAFNASIAWSLYQIFGRVPTCVGHTKEYVRFWQGLAQAPEPIPPLKIWQTEPRYKRHTDMWRQVDDFISGRTPIAEYMTTLGPDHATDVIESIWAGLGRQFFINTFNAGAVTNMQDDAFLELLCDVDMKGPRPLAIGEAPRGLRGLWAQVIDAHELTAEAAATGRRDILRRAMLTDPLVSSIADADAIIDELLAAEREALPQRWFT